MKKLFKVLTIAMFMSAGTFSLATTAFAHRGENGGHHPRKMKRCNRGGGGKVGGVKVRVPEVGAEGATSAAVLALGGAAVVLGGRRKQRLSK